MTNLNINTKPANDLTDDEYLARDLSIIYDTALSLYELSKKDDLDLSFFNPTLQMLIEKMANTFGQIESNLNMYEFCEKIREAKTEEERNIILNEYQNAPRKRREYE